MPRATLLTGFFRAAALLTAVASAADARRCAAQATGPIQVREPRAAAADARLQDAPPPATLRFDFVAGDTDHRIDRLIEQMTLAEKIGQLVQVYPQEDELSEATVEKIRTGAIGSLFYPGNRSVVDQAQRIATDESRLGIPLLIARDVIHGFRTVFPIPLGQAATWNPELVERAAAVAAMEARSERIDWTFAPMVDICRDSRWGRIAETLGEDPRLAGELAAAMVRGFQQEQDGRLNGVAACAKHYVGYGMAEGGRDYNRVTVSQGDLHNVILPPFRRSVDAGCRTFMTTFSEVNGVPGTAHAPLLRGLLKRDWGFSGVVVSDWGSVTEMVAHGYAEDDADAAVMAIMAGVDMDMCSPAFEEHLAGLVATKRVPIERIDDAVRRVLRCKVELARAQRATPRGGLLRPASLEAARETARQSIVMLKNDRLLPLDASELGRVAVIGPLADAAAAQLGCWSLDGKPEDCVTPLADLRERLGDAVEVVYAAGAKNSFAADNDKIAEAVRVASAADVALLFVGEDAVLSGEARCRSTLDLPGVQAELVRAVAETGVPTVLVFVAGRPLSIGDEVDQAGATLFAWHAGTMAGPAIGDILFGDASPSGKLPVTFPRSVGQTPIYYAHSNTGRPSPRDYVPLVGSGREDLPSEFQYRSHYLDEQRGPLYPFGFGLSYAAFEYSSITADRSTLHPGDPITLSAVVTNTGGVAADEVVQLYLRDLVSRRVRPVRELKGFRRVRLGPGESGLVEFTLTPDDLAYLDDSGRVVVEPGRFRAGIGGDSTVELGVEFELLPPEPPIAPAMPRRTPTAASADSSIR